jgi:hypothetical protein
MVAPINTEGPSFPNGTLIKNVASDVKKTPMSTLSHLKVISPLNRAIDEGMPPPLRRGIFLYRYLNKKARPNNPTKTTGIRYQEVFR